MAALIAEHFRGIAAAMPDALALTSAKARYTYADIDRWSDAIAADLTARDAPPERPVAIVVRDNITLVPAVIGAVKAGHFFVVLDATDPAERIAMLLETSNASITLTDRELWSAAAKPSLSESGSSAAALQKLVQLLFTSGTTGKPKMVAMPQRGFVERLVSASAITGRATGERVSYTALPGLARASTEIFGSLLNGATLCSFDARSESLDALGAFIERERISILTLTPALFRRFMSVAPADLDLSSVRKLRIGADVMTVADVEAYKARFPRPCTLERAFNATETGMVMHISIDHDTPIPGPLVPIGRPRPDVHVRLLGDDGSEVAVGEPGEMVVRSPFVANGYWNAPELTAQKFVFNGHDRTFLTGDLVKRDADGLYYFVGRKDSRLKIHGRRIDPIEVESALVQHAGVREATAIGKPDAYGELHLVAYVVMRDGEPCVPRAIRAALRDKLPAWMIPSRIHALDAMPMTGAGKVDRSSLALRVDDDAGDPQRGADDIERTLLEIWSRTIGAPVRPDDDFFDDLGGESLAAAHLVAEVRRVMGRTMPLSLLLELRTVATMADYLRVRIDMDRLAVVVQPGDARPPLFCVSGKGGSVIVFRRLASLLGAEQPFIGLTHDGFLPETFPKTFAAMAACYADAIRAIQPNGPYFLAGYSGGGLVAFDVARQLTLAGEQVAFVGLIDTGIRPEHDPWRKRIPVYLALIQKRPRVYVPHSLRGAARRVVRFARWLTGRGWTDSILAAVPLHRAWDTIRAREPLQPYSGRVTLFLARHALGLSIDPDAWRPLCAELDVVHVDGEHASMLKHDAESLAEAMKAALREASGVR